jgi:excisionase family DNA binding protein
MANRDDGEWLTLGEAARFLGVAQSTIRKWSDQARVSAFYTPGGHRRFRRADLEAFLNRSGPRGRPKEGPRVLVVDDDERVRELVRANLELEGCAVAEAGSAEAALAAMERTRPDLVLVDVMMPPSEGWELVRGIQERYGAGAIPMVTFSSKPDEGVPLDLRQLLDQAKQLLQ